MYQGRWWYGAVLEKFGVVFGVIPIVTAAVQKGMQACVAHRVIAGTNAGHGGDIGEFPNRRVGGIGKAVAIGVI